ncbi:MAG: hypothetical protein WDN69_22795 [Aliidongia sp.]
MDSSFTARALERLVAELADDPLLADELRVAAELDLPSAITLASVAHPDPGRAELAEGEPDHRLSAMLLYAEFAEAALSQAAERVRAIHALTLPYFADKAFTLRESSVIARTARVALDRDEAWLPPMLDELFLKVSVAPTAAKTMPSQSVAIALGHAIEAFPTPETVTSCAMSCGLCGMPVLRRNCSAISVAPNAAWLDDPKSRCGCRSISRSPSRNSPRSRAASRPASGRA